MSRWYKTKEELAENSRRLNAALKADYDAMVQELGRNVADRYFDWDAHCCYDFATNGGECAICGKIISGSPLSGDDDWYSVDPYYEYEDDVYYPAEY